MSGEKVPKDIRVQITMKRQPNGTYSPVIQQTGCDIAMLPDILLSALCLAQNRHREHTRALEKAARGKHIILPFEDD